MKIIHQNGYTIEELAMYRLTIYKNVIDCAKSLIGAMRQFDIEPENVRAKMYLRMMQSAASSKPPPPPADE